MKNVLKRSQLKTSTAIAACALFLASCGGGGGGPDPATLAAFAAAAGAGAGAGDSTTPAAAPPSGLPLAQAKCAIDTTVQGSYEEQRLPNKLASSDALSFSAQLLQASAFDQFGPMFAAKLCANGLAGASNYDDAVTLMHAEGHKLWQAALDRVQGRLVQGTLSKSDDRPLYWARLTMTLALRQWKPEFLSNDSDGSQLAALEVEFEKASRGQDAIDFPEGPKYKRILVSGFDPFQLGDAGQDGNLGIRTGNPSGATILSLDGMTVVLTDGTTAVVHTYILPVDYGPFTAGMQEDTIGPWFKPGGKRVDASVSMSQGDSEFDLEHYNGRYQFADFPGNDNLNPSCTAGGVDAHGNGFPASLDCDIFPPDRWLGYTPRPWKKDQPAQFTISTLPFLALISANTGAGITNRDTNQPGGWTVAQHDVYTVGPCTQEASTAAAAYDIAEAAEGPAIKAMFAAPPASAAAVAATDAFKAVEAAKKLLPNPQEINCALSGGGGNYLSNASGYRNTLMRDTFGLSIPAGHIHTPIMTYFASGSNGMITDATFEGRRDSIVAQARNIVMALASSLVTLPTTGSGT